MTTVMPDYTITKRVRDVWKKFSDWYGADVIAKHFGAIPRREWCEAIDAIATRQELDKILVEVRAKHVTFPPRFPEFEAICKRVCRPAREHRRERPISESLADYAMRTKPLTRKQKTSNWTYFGGADETFAGVVIPADPEAGAPGYRITVADMQLGADL